MPYRPDHYLPISLSGFDEGDFTLVFGFPGRTDEYLPAIALSQTAEARNPVKIGLRDIALKSWGEEMRANDTVKLAYANRYSSLANAWKKWQGESLGLRRTKAADRKKAYESAFLDSLTAHPEKSAAYGSLLPGLYAAYEKLLPYGIAYDATNEYTSINDICRLEKILQQYVSGLEKGTMNNRKADSLKKKALEYVSSRTIAIDRKTFVPLTEFYVANMPDSLLPSPVKELLSSCGGDFSALSGQLYSSPLFTSEGIEAVFSTSDAAAIKSRLDYDPGFVFFQSIADNFRKKIIPAYKQYDDEIAALMKDYMKAQTEIFTNKAFFPDANLTLRASYGQVKGMQARDGLCYLPQTYLDGVIEKYVPGDYEYDLPERLIELYNAKDYGRYGQNGRMPVCFIATNHTSGGNSGSPVINARGELIGLNFDRLWEGTMSDLSYDPSICRNIMVDIRYVLFLIDKLGGAGYLVDEMSIKE